MSASREPSQNKWLYLQYYFDKLFGYANWEISEDQCNREFILDVKPHKAMGPEAKAFKVRVPIFPEDDLIKNLKVKLALLGVDV